MVGSRPMHTSSYSRRFCACTLPSLLRAIASYSTTFHAVAGCLQVRGGATGMAAPVAMRVTIVTGQRVPMALQAAARARATTPVQVLHNTPAISAC